MIDGIEQIRLTNSCFAQNQGGAMETPNARFHF